MDPNTVNDLDLETLLGLAERLAQEKYGGHLTIFRFTTHWKCALGTPDLYGPEGSKEVAQLIGYPSIKEALARLIIDHTSIRSK